MTERTKSALYVVSNATGGRLYAIKPEELSNLRKLCRQDGVYYPEMKIIFRLVGSYHRVNERNRTLIRLHGGGKFYAPVNMSMEDFDEILNRAHELLITGQHW